MCWQRCFHGRNFQWVKRFLIYCAIIAVLSGIINIPKICSSKMSRMGFCSIQGFFIIFTALLGGLVVWFVILFLYLRFVKQFLVRCFPISCGHRKYNFTGKSSKTLEELLLAIDEELPEEDVYEQKQNTVLAFLEDVKETFQAKGIPVSSEPPILTGSVTERYGIPFCYKSAKVADYVSALQTDIDVMLCLDHEEMDSTVLTYEIVNPGSGFIHLILQMANGRPSKVISSKDIMENVKQALPFVKLTNFPGQKFCFGHCESFGRLNYKITGPAINVSMPPVIDCDITPCIKCCEWPPHSDWQTRQRCWPSQEDVNRIVSHGCHFVAKPAPSDKEQTSWRVYFSVAEVELSKLVPNTARKCLLALKIILKDHLQPVVAELTSYHLKTIFLNTLEKNPVDFWVDENIERCFFLLLNEFHDALNKKYYPHYWFRSVNLFQSLKEKHPTAVLIKKIKMITENPAPFIFHCRGRPLSRLDRYDDEVWICDELVSEQVGEGNDANKHASTRHAVSDANEHASTRHAVSDASEHASTRHVVSVEVNPIRYSGHQNTSLESVNHKKATSEQVAVFIDVQPGGDNDDDDDDDDDERQPILHHTLSLSRHGAIKL